MSIAIAFLALGAVFSLGFSVGHRMGSAECSECLAAGNLPSFSRDPY